MAIVKLKNSALIEVFESGNDDDGGDDGSNGNFVVTFTKENGTYVADASYSSIIEAEESKKHIVGVLESEGDVVEKQGFTYERNGNFFRLTLSEAGAVLVMQQITVGNDDYIEYYAGSCAMTPIFDTGDPA